MTTEDIEIAVANLLDYRVHIIVPNIHFTMDMECDLLVIDNCRRVTEIEIKTTLSDLKADFKKHHKHEHKSLSRLVYAFPESMIEKALPLIPLNCGIITVKENGFSEWYRICKHDKTKTPLTEKEVINIARLGCMRIWNLKKKHRTKTIKQV